MNNKNTVPFYAVEKAIRDGVEREFGAVKDLTIDASAYGLRVSADPSRFGAPVVSIVLCSPSMGPSEVSEYYINYPSAWTSAADAHTLSFILARVASIAADLEKLGVAFRA